MNWAAFVHGKGRKTDGDAWEAANIAAYDTHRRFEALALRVESVPGIQFAHISVITHAGVEDGVRARGNREYVEAHAPGLWDEVERVGGESAAFCYFLIDRARRLGRIL